MSTTNSKVRFTVPLGPPFGVRTIRVMEVGGPGKRLSRPLVGVAVDVVQELDQHRLAEVEVAGGPLAEVDDGLGQLFRLLDKLLPLHHLVTSRRACRPYRSVAAGFVAYRGPGVTQGASQATNHLPRACRLSLYNFGQVASLDSRLLTSRFRLTPSSAALMARARCVSGGTLTMNFPL